MMGFRTRACRKTLHACMRTRENVVIFLHSYTYVLYCMSIDCRIVLETVSELCGVSLERQSSRLPVDPYHPCLV